jgi:hypothetical protein
MFHLSTALARNNFLFDKYPRNTELHAGLHVGSDCSRNCKTKTNNLKTAQDQISRKSVKRSSPLGSGRSVRRRRNIPRKKRVEVYPREPRSFAKLCPRNNHWSYVWSHSIMWGLNLFSMLQQGFRKLSKVLSCEVVPLSLNINFHFTDREFHQENLRLVLSSYRDCTNLILKCNSH